MKRMFRTKRLRRASREGLTERIAWRQHLYRFLMVLYEFCVRRPLLRSILLDIQHRIRMIQADDEHSIRLQSVRYFLLVILSFLTIWVVVLSINRDVFSLMLLLFSTVYIYGFLSDILIRRLEMRLLRQLTGLIAQIRRRYHRHQMVYEAIYEAAAEAPNVAKTHALKIAECLASHHPQTAIGEYYETAPNKYLQALAGVAYLVFEFGDRTLSDGSLFQKSLAGLIGEIEMEHVRRQRLSFLLQSLQTITVLPLLSLAPLARWASDSFPGMGEFYASGHGFLCEIAIYVTSFLCFVLVRQLHVLEWGESAGSSPSMSLEKRLFRSRWIRVVLIRWMPNPGAAKYEWMRSQLILLGEQAEVELFYLRRLIYAILTGLLSTAVCLVSFSSFTVLQFIACCFIVCFAYLLPLFLLMFRRGMRKFALAGEVEQFETLLTILTPMERMNVEHVLEWMLRFAQHFQTPLQQCLLSFGAGGRQALEELRDQVAFEPFRQIVEQLIEAAERVDLRVAFDDLNSDRAFIHEQRKLQFEKNIAAKSAWGKLIGFVPLYAVIFIYLLIPMMFVGMQQMQTYYQQFQTL